MKNDILHCGKLYQFERQHIYQIHLNKINEITKKKNIRNIFQLDKFLPTYPSYPSGYKIEQQLRVKEQNVRLSKKLNSISQRKKFQILNSQENFNNYNQYTEQHKKYSQIQKQQRERSLQQENSRIVDKLLDKSIKQKIKEEYNRDQSDVFFLRKSRSKKKFSAKNKQKITNELQNRIASNVSLIDEYNKNQRIKITEKQRKRNYSTLLPTIDKISYSRQKTETVDHSNLLNIRKKYDDSDQKKGSRFQLHKNESKLIEKQQTEIDAENNSQNFDKANFHSDENEISVSLEKSFKEMSQKQISKKSSEKIQRNSDPMDPTLKFQKLKKTRIKKRQKINKVREQNEYEQQEFEIDIEIEKEKLLELKIN